MGCKDTTGRDGIRTRSGRKLGARRFHPDRRATSKKRARDCSSSFSASHSFLLSLSTEDLAVARHLSRTTT